MIQAVRQSVDTILAGSGNTAAPANLSLLFNRLCRKIDEPRRKEKTGREQTIANLVKGYPQESYKLYKNAFRRWRHSREQDDLTLSFVMRTTSPMVVGMGDQNVHEFGISLQLPWGTPMIPGSAVKGMLSTFAHEKGSKKDWEKSGFLGPNTFAGQHSLIMFGGTDEQGKAHAGCLDFLDCWWVPRTGKTKPFAKDIITVHNPGYYRGQENHWPDGTGDPNPVNFIVIQPGEEFFFAIRGVRAWCELARDMLKDAACEYGFGAKTRVGYGRMQYKPGPDEIAGDLSSMTDDELQKVFAQHQNDRSLASAFRKEADARQYNSNLEKFFRKFRPALVFLENLRNIVRKPDCSWRDISNEYQNFRKNPCFSRDAIDTTDPDIQEIYKLCEPYISDDLPKDTWIFRFAPAPVDLIQGRDFTFYCDLIEKYKDESPLSLQDIRTAIASSNLSDDDEELLDDEINNKHEKNNE